MQKKKQKKKNTIVGIFVAKFFHDACVFTVGYCWTNQINKIN